MYKYKLFFKDINSSDIRLYVTVKFCWKFYVWKTYFTFKCSKIIFIPT